MISCGIPGSCGVLEAAGAVAVLVATGVDRCFAFDGFELIPSRSGMNDCSGRYFSICACVVKRDADGYRTMLGTGVGSVHSNKFTVV